MLKYLMASSRNTTGYIFTMKISPVSMAASITRSATPYGTSREVAANEQMAKALGYHKVSDLKKAVVSAVEDYVARGGMMFAMCSATETFDIALAAENTDIVPKEFDGDGIDADYKSKLDYSKCFAFENFDVSTNPLEYRHSDIDTYPDRQKYISNPANDYFQLFDFAAKLDPVPTMLVQCHVGAVKGFMGQTTAFRKSMVKKYVTILGEIEGQDEVRYIHANYGKGTFTWLGGHDPEDYQHMVGDPPTDLDLYKDSPGYRLILNNVLSGGQEEGTQNLTVAVSDHRQVE